MEELQIYHISGGSPDPIKIKVEKNSKGYNWEVSVAGANIDEILAKIGDANAKLKAAYGVE